MYSCARTSLCKRALGAQGTPCATAEMLSGETVPETLMEHRMSKLFPFPNRLWCSCVAWLLSQQVWGRAPLPSCPVPLWALQQFLVCSAQPAGKICIVPQHPGGWTKPQPGSVTQGQDLALGPGPWAGVGSNSASWQQLLC